VSDFVFDQLEARIHHVIAMALAARADPGIEPVHQLRVAIRRTTVSIRALREWVNPRLAKKLRNRLRPVMQAAGKARNLDIAVELCGRAPRTLDLQSVTQQLLARRTHAAHQLLEELTLLRLDKLVVPVVPVFPSVEPRELAYQLLSGLVPRYWQAGEKAAAAHSSFSALHGFRLATKHLRYTMDLFAPAFGRGVSSRLALLKRVQTHLGEMNDISVTRKMKLISRVPALDEWLAGKQHAERKKFQEAWALEYQRSRAGATWVRYFTPRNSSLDRNT
jgi:CHAD domain-containing protein